MAVIDSSQQIQDPFLQSVLQATETLRQQSLALLDLINQQHDSSKGSGQEATLGPEVLRGQTALAAGVAGLRHKNRHLADLARETKATTSTSRAEVDRLHLGLQNRYYEQRHLVGEIASCEEYAHLYTQLPLIAEEQFLEKYPEWHSRRGETGEGNGEQGLMKARINEEKREREELEAQRAALDKRKTELMKENLKRKEELGSLDKQLEAFIEVCDIIAEDMMGITDLSRLQNLSGKPSRKNIE